MAPDHLVFVETPYIPRSDRSCSVYSGDERVRIQSLIFFFFFGNFEVEGFGVAIVGRA